ncbi:hypothetical protein A4157S3_160047 [Escherichia coli]|nr:hypothetical protein A4157S2_970050 [Escherichia coli]SOQ68403.1 hypothetical protein A4157S1_400046 [Escherichia coli]SOQ71639.1 hypothetical protein A4157S3_160047 [Escherichia coli]
MGFHFCKLNLTLDKHLVCIQIRMVVIIFYALITSGKQTKGEESWKPISLK